VTLVILAMLLMTTLGIGLASAADDFTLTSERRVDGGIRLVWTVVEDPRLHHYNIYWDEEEFDSVSGMSPKAASTGTTYLPDELEVGTRYYFAVTAVDENGTVLAEDFTDRMQKLPELDDVPYYLLMTVFFVVFIIWLYVFMKIPDWVKEHRGGA
jgi:hypothetical protein